LLWFGLYLVALNWGENVTSTLAPPQCSPLVIGAAVQVTTFGCFVGTAACLPLAGQLLSQLGAPYNPRGHNLRRSRPSRHGDQRACRRTTGTVDLVREDY
jgi:hypothetical protein